MHNEAVTWSIVNFLPRLQFRISFGDYVKYRDVDCKESLGEIVGIGASAELIVKKFSLMSSEVMARYSIFPLTIL